MVVHKQVALKSRDLTKPDLDTVFRLIPVIEVNVSVTTYENYSFISMQYLFRKILK